MLLDCIGKMFTPSWTIRQVSTFQISWQDRNSSLYYILEQHYVWIFLMTVTYGNDIWHYEIPHDTFAVSMPINIFKFIMRFITFTDKKRRPLRCCDKFAYLQELFQTIYKHNAQYIYPSSLLAINKSLYLNFGKLGFKQYNSSKAEKCSLFFRSLCVSPVSYTYQLLLYAGKPEEITQDSKYYVKGSNKCTITGNRFFNVNSIRN